MQIKYDVEIPKSVRNKVGKYKTIVLGFLATKKETMQVDFDYEKEAQSFVGFCRSETGKKLGVMATQRGKTAYAWLIKE